MNRKQNIILAAFLLLITAVILLGGCSDDSTGDKAYTTASYLAAGDKTDLTIKIAQDDWNKAAAGHYSDTVTFDISYTAINA